MDKFVILSEGNAFGEEGFDTIWGYVTSEENAKLLCDEYMKKGGKYYYLKNIDYEGNINLDLMAKHIRENREAEK